MERQPGQNAVLDLDSSLLTTIHSASTGTSMELELGSAQIMAVNASTCVLSAGTKATMHSLGSATISVPEDFLSAAHLPHLTYTDFSSSIIPHLPHIFSSPEHSLIFECISHPYNTDAFESLLLKHGLSDHYPLLASNLRHGFPLGCMPVLSDTLIIPNNPSIYGYLDAVDESLCKEVSSGRMSGPFSQELVELILRGPFQSFPIVVDVQSQEPGTPDKLRICQHLSKSSKLHVSVNSYMRKEEFPTHFDMASKVADIVSIILLYFSHNFALPTAPLCIPLHFVWGMFSFFCICSLGYLHRCCITLDILSSWSTSCILLLHILCLEHTSGGSRDILSSWCISYAQVFSPHAYAIVSMTYAQSLNYLLGCPCTSWYTGLHFRYCEISSYLPCPTFTQALACCPGYHFWPILHWAQPSLWCSLCQKQCRDDC